MRCVVCSDPIPSAQRVTRRYCSERCRYLARSARIGRGRWVDAADRPTDGLTYYGVHHRLRATHGAASEHVCPCGRRAQDWAYDNTDASELTCPSTGLAFSTDLARYTPMCRSCHRELDNAAKSARAQCGTEAGYYRHRRVTRTAPCRSCKSAHAEAARHRLTNVTDYDDGETP